MPISIEAFLKARRFTDNPFATTNAEQETDRLPSFFVRVPWFDRLVGDPRRPESLILFAPRGFGKTSHRLEVGRLASERREAPALVIMFTDFDLLLHANDGPVTIEHYLPLIRRITLEALDRHLQRDHDNALLLLDHTAAYTYFRALLRLYAPLRELAQPTAPAGAADAAKMFAQTRLSVKEWLILLSEIAESAGFASVYFLIDGIDEWAETNESAFETAIGLLRPLLEAPGVLQECRFAFKFFLPQSLETPMRIRHVGRLDRVLVYQLEWSDTELQNMLAQRLTSYSLFSETHTTGLVKSFQDLCDSDIDVDRILVRAADASPRRLIDLARRIVEEHCRQAADADMLIDRATIETVIRRAGPPLQFPAAPPTVPYVPGQLFVGPRGEIWIGEQRLETALPKLPHRCLEYLWQHRERIITYSELEAVLYPDDREERGDPRGSMYKIIRRLRAVLEPGHAESQTYIAVQPGIGYVLQHFRDD